MVVDRDRLPQMSQTAIFNFTEQEGRTNERLLLPSRKGLVDLLLVDSSDLGTIGDILFSTYFKQM